MQKTICAVTLAATAAALVAAPLVVGSAANALTIGCPGGAQGETPGCSGPIESGGGGLVIGTPGGAGGAVG